MTQEEKELLLKNLCARLPYCVIMGNKTLLNTHYVLRGADIDEAEFDDEFDDVPYLRPMSSMTEEEKKEYYSTMDKETHRNYPNSCDFSETIYYSNTVKTFDWLNSHHFDYRGLINKGLALEAPEEMYKEK